jgi:hypothetical protein
MFGRSISYTGLKAYAGRHMGALTLPALRFLTSALDLVAMVQKTKDNLVYRFRCYPYRIFEFCSTN